MTHFDTVLIDDLRFFLQPVDALVLRTEKAGYEWLESLTAEDTIGQLWLDHDLGENEHSEVQDIMSVVKLLESRAFFGEAPQIEMVLVHTSNGVGAKQMMDALSRFFTTHRMDPKQYFRRATDSELSL